MSNADNTIVVKFGGSCLSTSEDLVKAAKMVVAETNKGRNVVVVVSALKGTTDQLLRLAEGSTEGNISSVELDEILSMGERVAARLMASALRSAGVKSIPIDPYSDYWPIFTNDRFGNADPLVKETKKAVVEKLTPLIENQVVPVVCGFLGKTLQGQITTLGRGGSDTSAVLIGNCLAAKEVILVKDVEGVLTGDPDFIDSTALIKSLDTEEVVRLTSTGAKIIHPKALWFKPRDMLIRIVGFQNGDLAATGTVITGSGFPELEVLASDTNVSMVTIVGEEAVKPEALFSILSAVRETGGKILSAALEPLSLILYISGENTKKVVNSIHRTIREKGLGKAVSLFENLSMITVKGGNLETSPGIVDTVASLLGKAKINIFGILTISSSVRIFVNQKEKEKATELIKTNLEVKD
ncbi:MAG: aspartate kinase [Candidatus Freyarchaeota archaeon]|nr:aspartate kinase [Candidatus Jordarchaeia archaeon]MBS7268384.1 aspartate kinase [Candidatus Jordarchaeia archaeon]MBS7278578.1 aspartate kinase [Candidatus Jordarchaeia archaeon]